MGNEDDGRDCRLAGQVGDFHGNNFEQPSFRAFEAYGYAMACACVFEVILRLVLAEKEVARTLKLTDPVKIERERQKFLRRTMRATFGTLIQWVCGKHQVSPELKGTLKYARDARDHLAHHFWQANLGNLGSETGIDLIAAECNLTGSFFNDAGNALCQETGVNVAQYKAFIDERAETAIRQHPLINDIAD